MDSPEQHPVKTSEIVSKTLCLYRSANVYHFQTKFGHMDVYGIHSMSYKQTRYVDGTPTSEVTPVTIRTSAHPTMVTLVNNMVMNG